MKSKLSETQTEKTAKKELSRSLWNLIKKAMSLMTSSLEKPVILEMTEAESVT